MLCGDLNGKEIQKGGELCMGARLLHRFSRVGPFATPWTAAHQAALSMGFSRQEHWGGLPFPPPGGPPDPEIKPASPASSALQADSLLLSHREAQC